MQDYAKNITAARVERVICGYGEGQKAVAGLGGEFDFFELGAPLFIGENNEFLNEEINLETIRQYV
jgi:adenine-specific DNA-methyltransferase